MKNNDRGDTSTVRKGIKTPVRFFQRICEQSIFICQHLRFGAKAGPAAEMRREF